MKLVKHPILLVEDDDDDALIMNKILSRASHDHCDYQVTRASRLGEALDLLGQHHFDLILLDLSLPDAQGLETFRQLQTASPGIPIVICSGLKNQEVAVQAIAQGAQDYMVKGDVTESGFERVLRYALERRKVQEMREEFVGMVVHELRSPLTISIEGTKQILEGILGEITPDQRFFLEMVHKNMTRLNLLINDLLDITKIEVGKMKLQKEKFDLVSLVSEVCAGFRPSVESRGLKLQWNIPPKAIFIEADRNKLTQVFVNLLSNALKFTQQGIIEVALEDQDKQVQCVVSDTGSGIPKEDLGNLFNKFEQFGKPSASGEKGTGLGLAISKGIIMAHQGRIKAESEVGKGTRFVFIIPRIHALMSSSGARSVQNQ